MFQLHRFYCVIVILNYIISSQQYKVRGGFPENLIVVLKKVPDLICSNQAQSGVWAWPSLPSLAPLAGVTFS